MTRAKYILISSLLALVTVVSIAASPEQRSATELNKQRLAVVTKANQFIKAAIAAQELTPIDKEVVEWSIRTMEVERDLAPDKAGRVAAVQAHFKRMQEIESLVEKMIQAGEANQLALLNAQWKRLEAEVWLEIEKAK